LLIICNRPILQNHSYTTTMLFLWYLFSYLHSIGIYIYVELINHFDIDSNKVKLIFSLVKDNKHVYFHFSPSKLFKRSKFSSSLHNYTVPSTINNHQCPNNCPYKHVSITYSYTNKGNCYLQLKHARILILNSYLYNMNCFVF